MKCIITTITIVFGALLFAQGQEMNEKTFDFWVGEWDLSWQLADGSTVTGSNRIHKILDGKVIQENFVDPKTNFKGVSLSVYNPNTKTWHQTWTDNSGSYIAMTGEMVDGNPVFKTKTRIQDDKEIISRMVFKEISENTLVWDWETTEDGGNQWKLLWRINYKRKEL